MNTADQKNPYPAPVPADDAKRVLFVCLGNICRSPAAEGVLRAMAPSGWEIDSAGTGRYHIGDLPDSRMRAHARRRGYELTHRCRQVCADDFRHFDLIVGMDAQNLANLRRMCPDPALERKIVPMARYFDNDNPHDCVPDPYYEGPEGFELVLDLLEEGCRNMVKQNLRDNERV